MKKLLFIISLLVCTTTQAQLVIKDTNTDTVIWEGGKNSTIPKILRFNKLNSYVIYYKNATYSHIIDVAYLNTGDLETTKQFYELCKVLIAENKKQEISLNNETIILTGSNSSVMIWRTGSYFYLTNKQIDEILSKL
jgi:hypothetical protein